MADYSNEVREVAAFFFLKEGYTEEEALPKGQRFYDAAQELIEFLYRLNAGALSDELVQAEIYEIGKRHYGTERHILREWFADIYFLMTCGRDKSGPRLGVYVNLLTPQGFAMVFERRLQKPFMY